VRNAARIPRDQPAVFRTRAEREMNFPVITNGPRWRSGRRRRL